ncbi:membrane protein insertion efficiency factor YidD [Endozoicomonadaceae bacterium StTr2]
MKRLLLLLIRFYSYAISPLLGKNCRFYPSCSSYAHQALEEYGLLKGGKLAFLRIMRCHPWHPGGFDPVPGSNNKHPSACVAGQEKTSLSKDCTTAR